MPQSTNILLELPAHASNVDTWDIPVNANSSALDGYFGGVQTVSVTSSPVTLTSPAGVPTPGPGPTQAQNAVLRVSGALAANVQITLPLPGYMIVENLTTGNFVLTLRALGVGEIVGIEQGSCQHVYNDNNNVRFVNLPPVGSYMDISDAALPAWISACSKQPWLVCDGSTFNAATFPYLNARLSGNTLPDFRGRSAYYLNAGTSRLTGVGAGIDGNGRFNSGGNDGINLTTSQIPSLTSSGVNSITVTSTLTNIGFNPQGFSSSGGTFWFSVPQSYNAIGSSGNNTITVTYNNGAQTNIRNAPPGIVSGIRLIRAA